MLICAPVDDNLCEEIKQYLERARGDHYKSHNTINIICLNHNLITFPFFITLTFTVIQTEC